MKPRHPPPMQHTRTALMVLCFSICDRSLYRLVEVVQFDNSSNAWRPARWSSHHCLHLFTWPLWCLIHHHQVPAPYRSPLYITVQLSPEWPMSLFVQDSPSLHTSPSSNYYWSHISKCFRSDIKLYGPLVILNFSFEAQDKMLKSLIIFVKGLEPFGL